MSNFAKPPKSHLMTYRIARGEQGVLTYEPYKSYLLPHWRFRTVPIARTSSQTLWQNSSNSTIKMISKFIQMGMTRSKRYANYKGGRKYVDGKEKGETIEKSRGHEGKEEKEEASRIFREVWERCREHEGYGELKKVFLKEQKEWFEMKMDEVKDEGEEERKSSTTPNKRESRKAKSQGDPSVKRELSPKIKSEND